MKFILNSKLRYMLFLSVAAAAVIFICALFIVDISRVQAEDGLAYFDKIASETANIVENRLESLLSSLRSFTYLFTDFESLPKEEKTDILLHATALSLFHDIAFVDKEGNAFSAVYGDDRLGNRDFLRSALDGDEFISETPSADFGEKLMSMFAVPIRSNGEITGVLTGSYGTDSLQESIIYTGSLDGKATNYIVTRSEATVVLAPQINILEVEPRDELFEKIDIAKEVGNEIKASIAVDEDVFGNFSFDFEGESFFASYNSIGINDWIVVSVVKSSDILAVTDNMFNKTVMFIGFFALFVIAGGGIWAGSYWFQRKKRFEAAAERDSLKNVDALTGGPSFDKFLEDVRNIFDSTPVDGCSYSMISMDINKFRTVNDHLGHEEGGKILAKLARLIQMRLTERETYTRKNADTFYAIIKYVSDIDIFAQLDSFINDAYYQIEEYKLILSFGVYKIDDLTMDVRSIIDRADLARKTIKGNNESSYAFFDENMLTKIREEKRIENIMEFALESNEFKVYLQPKYDLNSRTVIIGAEALIRWFREGKMISPGAFIPIFEKNGFITKVDKFVFEEVCKQQKLWLNRGYDVRAISVNMSRINLHEPNFVRDLYEICNKYNVPTRYFEIEITESVAFENLDTLTRVFNELKNYGFHISIDDFGTGYSSLNMLKNLPVDILKIDRSFLTDTHNERANNIIHHVINLAMSLHMKTICEGIETIEQVNLLSDLKCDMAQGFYFARPMPIDEYEKLLYSDTAITT
jgi:diguanylate cyclase (GGDEF)-like protein